MGRLAIKALSVHFVQIASEHKESGIAAAFCC